MMLIAPSLPRLTVTARQLARKFNRPVEREDDVKVGIYAMLGMTSKLQPYSTNSC